VTAAAGAHLAPLVRTSHPVDGVRSRVAGCDVRSGLRTRVPEREGMTRVRSRAAEGP
jgi:hypothetical protein